MKAAQLKEKFKKILEMDGVVTKWDRSTGAGLVSTSTKEYEINPELVKSFGDERMPMDSRDVTFEVGEVDGKTMVTSLSLKED